MGSVNKKWKGQKKTTEKQTARKNPSYLAAASTKTKVGC